MTDDASGHDAFMAALDGGDPAPSPQPDPGPVEAPQAQPQGEGGQPQPEPAPQPGGSPAPRVAQDGREPPPGWVPQWRLNEMAEERRRLAAEAAELRQWRQEREEQERRQKAEAELKGEDFYGSDPQQFIDRRLDHRFQTALGPVAQQFQQMQEAMRQQAADFSHQMGVQQHGAEKVSGAYERVQRAIQGRDPTALAIQARVNDPRDPASRDPTRAIMDWDRRHSVYEATGGDLDKYRQTYADELLKDPAFLARAQEAHRQLATPVSTGVPGRAPPAPNRGLPSLNRQTSAQDDRGEEDLDDASALSAALGAPRR